MARRPFTGNLVEGFGPRPAPIEGASTYHLGWDGVGDGNFMPEGGILVSYGYAGSYGYLAIVAGWDTAHEHWMGHHRDPSPLIGIRVPTGEGVKAAEMGSTGNSTGKHCHWEVHRPGDGVAIDPGNWLYMFAGTAGGGGTPIEEDDLDANQAAQLAAATENSSEARRMLGVVLGGISPANATEAQAVQRWKDTNENAAECRRMLAVVLGARAPGNGETRPGDPKAIAEALAPLLPSIGGTEEFVLQLTGTAKPAE